MRYGMEIKLFAKVFCTEDYEDNNTGGKIGTVLEKTSDDVTRYLVAFPRESVLRSNTHWLKTPDTSTWWIPKRLLRIPYSNNKFS